MGCSGKCPGWDEHVPGRGIIAEVQCGSARCPRGQTAEVPEWGELRVAAGLPGPGSLLRSRRKGRLLTPKSLMGSSRARKKVPRWKVWASRLRAL